MTKTNQKTLKALYTEELKKAWDDEKMVKFCASKTAYVVEHNGNLFGIEKPKINKDFCFGAGMYATATDEEINNAEHMVNVARTNTDYFIKKNLEQIEDWIKALKDIREQMGYNWAEGSHPRYMLETGANYNGQTEDCKLCYYCVIDAFNNYGSRGKGKICWDVQLIDKLIEGYEAVKVDFIKHLNTYLKRYGLSKVNAWSYIRD